MTSSLRDQHVLILGLGASGLSMARWCLRLGARVTVVDTRAQPPQLAVLRAELGAVAFRQAALDAELVEGSDVRAVFKSPGLAPAQVQSVVAAAQRQGLWVGGELDLFVQALAQLRDERHYAPRVLAVTGTNGKTTVTALTAHLLAWAGQAVAMAGNIGPALLDTLSAALEADSLPQVWVLELSSFQLEGVSDFVPTAATVLNITQDHLDWHGSMQAYIQAKAAIVAAASTLAVLNRDDAAVMALLPAAPPKGGVARTVLSFGSDLPQRAGDFGLETVNGMLWLVRAHEAEETRRRRKDAPEPLFIQRLMPADALRIRGRHNACNALAALALCTAAGCALAPILFGLRAYRGEPHRVQSVAVVRGVEYFDDSKGTNVGATVAALQGLGPDRRVVLILGGDGKGQDFAPLASPVATYVRAVVLIGRDAPRVRTALQDCGVLLVDAPDMGQAVQRAAGLAHEGDAVLMSPACASLDMFDNYAHRARVFCSAVQELADAAGTLMEPGVERA